MTGWRGTHVRARGVRDRDIRGEGDQNQHLRGQAPSGAGTPRRPRRPQRRRLLILAAVALLTLGCSDQLDDLRAWFDDAVSDDAADADATSEGHAGAGSDAGSGSATSASLDDLADPDRLDCRAQDYACTWDEVEPHRIEATAELALDLDEQATDGWDPEQLAQTLAAHDEVVEAMVDDVALWFRLEGARPVWVASANGFAVEDEDDLQATATNQHTEGTATALDRDLTPPSASQPAVPAGVVGQDPASKSALVINPFDWESDLLGARGVAEILAETRGYEDNVEHIYNPSLDEQVVSPDHFLGWEEHDVVHVTTHGFHVCEGADDEGPCWTALALGQKGERVPANRVEEDLLRAFGYHGHPGATIVWHRGQAAPALSGDWLSAHYAGRLDDTLVFIEACSSSRAGDLQAGLSGESSVFLGWSAVAFKRDAGPASWRFYEEASERGVTSTTAYDELVADGMHRSEGPRWVTRGFEGADDPDSTMEKYRIEDGELERVTVQVETHIDAELQHFAPGMDLRIREVIELQDPQDGTPLTDGRTVPMGEDEHGPTLPVRLEVDGILPGEEGDTTVELIVNGVTVAEGWRLDTDAEQVDPETYRIEETVGLPIGFAEADTLTLDARVALPEGGQSQHVVDLEPLRYELRFEAQLGMGAEDNHLEGSFPLSYDVDAGVWTGQASPDWLTYTHDPMACPGGPRTLDASSDVEVARADVDVATGTVELDLRWREDRGPVSVPCDGQSGVSALSEHEVAVTGLILALGGSPMDASPGTLPDRLLDFVGPETVRFTDWTASGDHGFVYEQGAESSGMTGSFRLELADPTHP